MWGAWDSGLDLKQFRDEVSPKPLSTNPEGPEESEGLKFRNPQQQPGYRHIASSFHPTSSRGSTTQWVSTGDTEAGVRVLDPTLQLLSLGLEA